MNVITTRRARRRLVATAAAAASLVAAGNAVAGWETLGNGSVRVWYPGVVTCTDGIRVALADNGILDASHPWVFEHVKVTVASHLPPAAPPAGLVGDAIVVLPTNPVDVGNGVTFYNSGTVRIPYVAPLPSGTAYARLWFGSAGAFGDVDRPLPLQRGCSSELLDGPRGSCFGVSPTIVGTPGNDAITGTPQQDVISGLGGKDTILGGGGDDIICGGPGGDVIAGNAGQDEIDGGTGRDTLYGEFPLRGGSGNNYLRGGPGPDVLWGANGDDILLGGDGADALRAGSGFDALDGGPGADLCTAVSQTSPHVGCES